MTARAKIIVIASIVLALAGALLVAAVYAQGLAQRLQGIAPSLSLIDRLVVDFLCAFRDQLLTDLDHARLTVYCTVGI
ncbi:MAG: hypothetical protein OXG60_09260 [Chloroflexi bacterium]|nr:hypothetical protein [Chloroflexota bacterium]